MRLAIIAILFSFPFVATAGLEWESTHVKVPTKAGAEEVIGVFKFTNTGEEAVTITKVHSSCGCTVPKLEKTVYEPGESGQLEAVFSLGDRTGPQRKAITVMSDEPGHSTTRLLLETNIPELASIRPKMLLWRRDTEAEWKEVTISTDAENQVLVPEEGELPEHELTEVDGEPGQYVLKIKPASTDAIYQKKFPLLVRLADGSEKAYSFYVLVR